MKPFLCPQGAPAAPAGPTVSAAGGAVMNLPPFSGQMGTDAWMGPGGSIPALRPGSTLTPGEPAITLACGIAEGQGEGDHPVLSNK